MTDYRKVDYLRYLMNLKGWNVIDLPTGEYKIIEITTTQKDKLIKKYLDNK